MLWLTRMPCVRGVWSSNPGPTISYTALQTVCHRFNIYTSSCVALALWRGTGHRYTLRRKSASIIKCLDWF